MTAQVALRHDKQCAISALFSKLSLLAYLIFLADYVMGLLLIVPFKKHTKQILSYVIIQLLTLLLCADLTYN